MNTDKIVGYIGLLIAILVGVELVAIPYAALLLLISGFVLATTHHQRRKCGSSLALLR